MTNIKRLIKNRWTRYLLWRYGSYDVLYQNWLKAKRANKFKKADRLRMLFEEVNKLTIFAEGEMPVEGITTRKIKMSKWERKYGNPKVAIYLERLGL